MKRRLDALASLGLPIMITESNFYTNCELPAYPKMMMCAGPAVLLRYWCSRV